MSKRIYTLMRALAGVENGADCRSCGEAIHPHDAFGRSERVCTPCRND